MTTLIFVHGACVRDAQWWWAQMTRSHSHPARSPGSRSPPRTSSAPMISLPQPTSSADASGIRRDSSSSRLGTTRSSHAPTNSRTAWSPRSITTSRKTVGCWFVAVSAVSARLPLAAEDSHPDEAGGNLAEPVIAIGDPPQQARESSSRLTRPVIGSRCGGLEGGFVAPTGVVWSLRFGDWDTPRRFQL
jgi:hypothetical protein